MPIKVNSKIPTPRHNIIKLSKVQEKGRNWKTAREKWFLWYKGSWVILRVDFSSETIKARKQEADISKVLEGKDCQPRSISLSFKNKDAFGDKSWEPLLLAGLPHKKYWKGFLHADIPMEKFKLVPVLVFETRKMRCASFLAPVAD